MKKILSIRPQALRSQADELEKLRRQHNDLMRELRVLVVGLSDSWKGEAEEAFVNRFLSESKNMSQLDSTISGYVSLARKAADDAEAADRSLATRFRSMMG